MDARSAGNSILNNDTARRTALIGGLIVGSGLLGGAVITAGGESSVVTMALGALALVALGGLIALILDWPVIGIVRFAFIASFFFKGDVSFFKIDEIEDPSGLNLSLTLFIGLFLLAYDQFFDNDGQKVFPRAFSILFAGLAICATISVLYSGPTSLGGVSLVSFFTSLLITYVTASHFGRRGRLIHLVMGIGAGVLFTGMVALSQFAVDWPTNLSYFGTGTEDEQLGTQSVVLSRVPAFLRTPTEMAWVVSSLIPLVIAPVICRVKSFTFLQRVLLIIAAFAGVVGIILSLARGSWIGLVASILLMVSLGWLRLSGSERKSYFVSVGAALLLVCVVLLPFSGRIYDRLTADDEGSASIRIPLMENALRMIEANPFVGVGLSGYRTNMTKHDDTGVFVSQIFPQPVHNVFAHVTTEIGIPGGIIFGLLILFSFYECFKTMSTNDRLLFAVALGASVSLVAFVISGIKEPGSLGSGRPPIRTFFLLLGAVMAISRVRNRLTA